MIKSKLIQEIGQKIHRWKVGEGLLRGEIICVR